MQTAAATPLCPVCGYPRGAAATAPCARCGGEARRGPEGPVVRAARGVPIVDLAHGFQSLFRAAIDVLHRREYVGQLALPIAANLVAITAALVLFWLGFWRLFEWLVGVDWGVLEFLRAIVSWVSWVLAMVLAVLSLFLLAPVLIETVTSPFLDPLAQTTERLYGGPAMTPLDRGVWQGTLDSLRSSAQILTIQLALWLPVLLLSVTGVGFVIALVICAWLNALVAFDVPCTRRGYGLRDRLRLIGRNWARAIGFGLAFQLGLFVPFFNLLLLTPAAAVATSRLYFHFEKPPLLGNVAERTRARATGGQPDA